MKATLIIAALVSVFSSQALADKLVTCKTISKKPVTVLEYTHSDLGSSRLSSPIIFTKNAVVSVFNQHDVAQFKVTAVDLFVMVDDVSENKVLQLFAAGSKGKFLGAVTEFNSLGGISKNTAVACAISQI